MNAPASVRRRRRCQRCRAFIPDDYGPKVRGWAPTVCGDCCTCTNETPGRCRDCGAWDIDEHPDAAPDFTPMELSS